MIQDLVGNAIPAFKETNSWSNNLIGSAISCGLWGYLLYAGVIDPFGGIYTMWTLFGTANQMLAAIALTLCTVVLYRMKLQRYAWVTIVPTVWLVVCTVTAGLEKAFSANPAIGFFAQAGKFGKALADGNVLAPAKTLGDMSRVVFNNSLDGTLAAVFVAVVVLTVAYGVIAIRKALGTPTSTAHEVGVIAAAGGAR
jgi:carbon starvation protein